MSVGGLVPIARLRANPANIRKDLGDLSELTASIRARGVLQPLVVAQTRGESLLVLDGHRRLAAARAAGLTAVPCLAAKPGDATRDIAIMLATAMHKELTPLERGKAFRTLRERGLRVAEIARQSGYSTQTVSRGLYLADLPPEAQALLAAGDITAADGVELARETRATGRGEAFHRQPKAKYFTDAHRLAEKVAARCGHAETRQVIGGVGCGQCWEDEIREDERDREAARSHR